VLDKSKIDKELARRLSAAFISNQMGVSITTQYKKTPEDVGDLWYFLAALADKLARESQEGVYPRLGTSGYGDHSIAIHPLPASSQCMVAMAIAGLDESLSLPLSHSFSCITSPNAVSGQSHHSPA